MRAREALEALLADFQEAAPQADVRESYAQEPASRRISRPLVAGRIVTERRAGEVWEAKLGFTLYLPQGQTGETASSLLDRFVIIKSLVATSSKENLSQIKPIMSRLQLCPFIHCQMQYQ